MPFDQSTIIEVFPPTHGDGQVHLSWTSSSPDGSWWQVYAAGKLVWFGRSTAATIPTPPDRARIAIGTVPPSERAVDFSASLPPPPNDRVTLSWTGGAFEGDDLAGFRVYQSPSPGAAVDYTAVAHETPAYTPGVYTDGFGMGTFGDGGFGSIATSYSWTSESLASGVWTFAVVPFDAAGNEGDPSTVAVLILAPPRPPARNASGDRLTYTYSTTTRRATLDWLASPG